MWFRIETTCGPDWPGEKNMNENENENEPTTCGDCGKIVKRDDTRADVVCGVLFCDDCGPKARHEAIAMGIPTG